MARPETHADLTDERRAPVPLIEVKDLASLMTGAPTVARQVTLLIEGAQANGLVVDHLYSEVTIGRPLTDAELDNRLDLAQREWDCGQKLYMTWQETGEFPKYGYEWDSFLKAEGIAKPKQGDPK